MKDVIKAKEEGVKGDGELTYSRLQEQEGFGICLKNEEEGRFDIPASNQDFGVNRLVV